MSHRDREEDLKEASNRAIGIIIIWNLSKKWQGKKYTHRYSDRKNGNNNTCKIP